MSRAFFNRWGSELSAADFACALAALGVLEASGQPDLALVRAQRLSKETGQPFSWKLTSLTQPPPFNAAALAQAWRRFILTETDLRLEICAPWPPFDPIWLIEQLSRPEVGAGAVFLAKDRRPRDQWHWPLRIGFLHDAPSRQLRSAIEQKGRRKQWHKDLTDLIDLSETENRCDLLVLPQGPRQALARILETPFGVHAVSALIAGPAPGSRSETIRMMQFIDEQLSTSAIGYVSGDSTNLPGWLHLLVTFLSHDSAFDLALMEALGDRSKRPACVLMANAEWMNDVRVSALASILGSKLSVPEIEPEKLLIRDVLASRLNITRGWHQIPDVWPTQLFYDSERKGATTLALLTNQIRPKLRAVERRSRRVLQAQVFLPGATPAIRVGPVTVFYAGATHEIDVRIALPDDLWLQALAAFPEEKLPPSPNGHQLTVVFIEPELAPEPQVDHIFLPPTGASGVCTFSLQTPVNASQVNARIVVAYKNRVLQTSLLRGVIVAGGVTDVPSGAIQFVPEVVVSPGMSDLDRQPAYGAALIFNHTESGDARVLKLVEDSAVTVRTGDLTSAVQKIEDALARADWGAKDYRGLAAKGTERLLLALAAHGTTLYRGIVKNQFGDSQLAVSGRLQLIAAKPDSRLPVEYFYELPSSPGGDGKLCPEAEKSLDAGKCSAQCKARLEPGKYVCPLGFWGMTKVLEWHTFRPEAAAELRDRDFVFQQERLASRKQLKPLAGALIGASDRANKAVPNSVPGLVNFIKKSKVPSQAVRTWPEWQKWVNAHSPSLLILLPHTDTDTVLDIAKMEIGTGQWLTVNQLDESYVRSKSVQPIVLLLGCDTAQQHVTFEDFISNFATGGAAIVVGSNATILGRQAAPLAREFVDVLKQIDGRKDVTFGDVMLAVRRNMMRKGYPMVLSISSYGDADWRL